MWYKLQLTIQQTHFEQKKHSIHVSCDTTHTSQNSRHFSHDATYTWQNNKMTKSHFQWYKINQALRQRSFLFKKIYYSVLQTDFFDFMILSPTYDLIDKSWHKLHFIVKFARLKNLNNNYTQDFWRNQKQKTWIQGGSRRFQENPAKIKEFQGD